MQEFKVELFYICQQLRSVNMDVDCDGDDRGGSRQVMEPFLPWPGHGVRYPMVSMAANRGSCRGINTSAMSRTRSMMS